MGVGYRLANGDRLPVSVSEAEGVAEALLEQECTMGVLDYNSIALDSIQNIASKTRSAWRATAVLDPELATAYSYVIDCYEAVVPRQLNQGDVLLQVT
ncbi:MAG: hypothetical protein WBP26_02190 [Candidatus Saccharimonadales bacterium]